MLKVKYQGNNNCPQCRTPLGDIDVFEYEGDTVDAATQTEEPAQSAAAAVAMQEENDDYGSAL